MSDLLPTKEQEKAAVALMDRCFGDGPSSMAEDVALLLAEREEALRVVISRLRACLHETLSCLADYDSVSVWTYEEMYKALRETVQYEVME